jgi:nucleoside-diphosphate-sugar epimerase
MTPDNQGWFRGRKVLVLGATGFMGQYLIRALELMEADITILTHIRPIPEVLTTSEHTELPRIRIFRGDMCDSSLLSRLVADQEIIYALAGKSGTVQSNMDPLLDLDINCRRLLNLLECCRAGNPRARIVFPSSRLVYGKVKVLPVPEICPTEPTSIYGIHKLTCEKYLAVYHRCYSLPTVVLRITNPYGFEHQPAQFTHGIINEFYRKALRGESLTVFGDGHQIRDYVYVEDVVQAFLAAGKMPAAVGQVFNVGGGKGVSLGKVAETIVQLVGSGSVKYQAWSPDYWLVETGDFVADIGKISIALEWSPQVAWQEGLTKVHLDWLHSTSTLR